MGETVHEILKIAEAEKVDLIIIGRKKRVGGATAFIGSHAHKIITRSKYPILVSKYMVEFDWDDATLTQVNKAPFENPLFAVDRSDRTDHAIDLIISLKGIVRKVFLFFNIDEKTLEKSSIEALRSESLKNDIAEKLDEYSCFQRDCK